MRTIKSIIGLLLTSIILFTSTPASAQAWKTVEFRMGAPAKYWLQVAECESASAWNSPGITAGGLQIHTNGNYGEPNQGLWEKFGGEQFAPSPDKASQLEQIIVANRISILGWLNTEGKRIHPIGFNAWPCIKSEKIAPYGKIYYRVNIPDDPSQTCPRYENMFRTYGLPVKIFSYIAYRESRCNPGAVNAKWKNGKMIWTLNSNGTYDSGLLQINSSWFRTLKDNTGHTSADLLDPKVNSEFASWILLYTSSRLGNWSIRAH